MKQYFNTQGYDKADNPHVPCHPLQFGVGVVWLLLVACLAWLPAPAMAAVAIDQSPLILKKPLPPNLVLMLDDSGSMGWDFMPDAGYINPFTLSSLRNASINYVYYDPSVTYLPPVHADGTSYPDASFPNAWVNGFDPGAGTRNIQFYSSNFIGGFNYYAYQYVGAGGNYDNGKYNFVFAYTDKTTGQTNYVGQSCLGFNIARCTTSAAAQQNVANWFSYYHTRILMVKTGLTRSFASLDPNFRVGFGSINNSGAEFIKDELSYTTENGRVIADVKPFGDGASGTQKAEFWTWITKKVSPGGGTPLRRSLQAVGQYYQTSQPWVTGGTGSDSGTSYACRPAYTILTTDGFWNGGSPGVGNVDGTTQATITSPTPPTPPDYQYTPQAPFRDSSGNTLADVAMKYWVTDLRPTLANEVPVKPNDPAFWQHMTTFTVGLGFDPVGLPSDLTIPKIFQWARTGNPPAGYTNTSNNIWPAPDGALKNITDLAHAAVNGHGDFFSAKDPTSFQKGISSALGSIADAKGAGSAITLSGQTTATTSSDPLYQFRATYLTGQWTGRLTADKWNATATPPAYAADWDANTKFPAADARNIWTVDKAAVATTSQTSVAFKLDSGGNLPAISSAEKAGLDYYVNGAQQTSVTRAMMLDYLRGDQSCEVGSTTCGGSSAGTLRDRKALLGDVVSSTPVYVASPDKNLFVNASFPGASTYSAFVSSEANRTPLVYVAANDGMLHAFRVKQGLNGSTPDPSKPAGQEVYAYMPGAVLRQAANTAGGISNLANPDYGKVDGVTGAQAVPHQFYNDGRITTQNVYMDTGDGKGLSWHTILVGTTGRGPARAVYALDITDPTVLTDPTKSAKALLWERSAGDIGACAGTVTVACSNYIGEMNGAPVIAQIQQNGTTSAANPPKWAVFLGNGYNSTVNKAALLQFDLATGTLDVHPVLGLGNVVNNGLAEPGLRQPDKNNGESTQAYAGDLYGHVWQFDLTDANSLGHSVFIAKDPSGNPQPITSLVALDYDSKTNSTWALFGTGKYLSNADVTDTQIQTWYGLRVDEDVPQTTPPTPIPASTPIVSDSTTRSDLTERTILYQDASKPINRATSQQVANDMANKAGWYMDLTYSGSRGERIVNRTQFIAGLATVTTLIPQVTDVCNPVPAGAVMIVDPFTGANLADDFGLGYHSVTIGGVTKNVPFNGVVLSNGPAAGVTGVYNANGTISLTLNTLNGETASLGPLTVPGAQAGRVSWRELFN